MQWNHINYLYIMMKECYKTIKEFDVFCNRLQFEH